ncbi:superoxide dismutase [Desulfosarcina alkanivorans]|uniref:Superoxide dismutase n=1 Tax=Desulfosarcina alkanivorans TaxID=571177 RepID=A0A5K7YHW6_9BACT|nr:superoxide dismutase [Desulfosarcina alkanivorans]BBO68538.1 superoxide dismutase [Desulfosarcina alkanivorans]
MAPFTVIGKRLISRLSLLAACAAAALFLVQCGGGGDATVFVKEPLPYSQDALAPFISADTMGFHYDKHYAGYVNNANRLIRGIGPAGNTPEAVIRMTAGDASRAAIFNNAAQAWNHAYFFKCLKPDGGGAPEGLLAEMIDASFGSFTDFKALFLTAAKDQFGSGWVWLVLDEGRLAVVAGANADTPLAHDLTPLFTVDVWEHAYYLDYQNRRVDFVKTVLDNLANWDFVAAQLEKAIPADEKVAADG